MTRINVGINPAQLTDEHLLAEHREIKRLPWCIDSAIRCSTIRRIPPSFSLGKGHVTFFLDKMLFTWKRYMAILTECRNRGFRVKDYSTNWANVSKEYMNDYSVTDEDRIIVKARIEERIRQSVKPTWHYRGKEVTKEEAIGMLNE